MRTTAELPIRLITHNIRYATSSPFKGEKPWADRKPLLLNELKYNALYNPEAFVCLQEVLHNQLVDVMGGLGDEWDYIGVGRDDGKERGEYSPIIYRKGVWNVDNWKTVWLSADVETQGWDAASIRIVTVGTFTHQASKVKVVGMCTHFDDQGTIARTNSAKLILKIIDEATTTSSSSSSTRLPIFLGGDFNSEPSESAYQILNSADSSIQDVKQLAPWHYGNNHYTLANPDTLTKYKTAATIAEKVLKEVTGWIVEDANIVELCERGDKLLEEETSKVYKGKKIAKGIGHCTTISPSSYITPYTPLKSDPEEAGTTLKAREVVKIQLGAQIDGFCAIVCDSVVVGSSGEVSGREADLLLATYYANELLLRLMVPPGLVAHGTEEEQKKAASRKPYTQTQITQMLEKVVSSYDCNLVESTTIWLFDHNEIEAKKKIILAPGDGVKGEGLPEVGEAWGVEMGVSLGSGKVKTIDSKRATLHRRTATTYGLKRPTSRQILSEVVKKFGTFPFSLRQLEDEKAAKVGVIECVRGGVLRQYEVVGDKNNDPVARLFTTIAITKNGIQRLAKPPPLDVSKYKTDKRITDEEILKILEQPVGKTASKNKNRKKKKKPAKKAAAVADDDDEEESSDEDALTNCSTSVDMPALRKRKSRTGTPLATPTDTPPRGLESRKEKTQSSLDAWVEPAPQNPAPSFEEHGFARHGVLETMAPLGVPPSSRVKQKLRGTGDLAGKPAPFGRKSNAFVGEEDGTTPEMTPAPELDRDDSERPDDDDVLHVAYPELDEDEDDDYMPTKKKQKTAHGAKTPVRGKGLAHGKSSAHGKTPVKNGVRKTSTALPSPVPQSGTLQGLDAATQQRIRIAVNDAIARSNKNGRRNVGCALKEMLERSLEDPKLAKSLDGVIHQKETAEDWSLFRQFIKSSKKKSRLQTKIQQAEEAAKAAKEAATAPTTSGQFDASSPSAESEIAPNDSASVILDPDPAIAATTELSKAINLAPQDAMPLPESQVDTATGAAAPHPLTTAPTFSAAKTSAPLAPRMNSKSPRKQQIANGHLATTRDATADASTAAPTPADKTPDSGAGSDSALSEVDEDILSAPQPPPAKVNGTSAAPISKKAKNAALARAGKKSRQNSMKPFGKHKEKPPPTPEELAEQVEIQKRRQELEDEQQSLREQMARQAPISETRFDDEMLETESLTESQIAVGPPVDASRPRRAGRAPRNNISIHTGGAKRPRDDNRFSSPRLDSATTSRPSTPAAFSHVPNKRVKLNNGQAHQSARTKKSPVKNRDGPIAGIPHTGGGGSRQLGPDDNDPGSPPSESDDLCSACKGAGEFVCCDNCPRVFHFLCCDPPRLDAPQGSFLCHECTAKLKPAEEPAVESYPSLGPLFKSLESINARAFALPAEIRDRFENVAARPDGSYAEESKKFPLAKSSGYGYQKPDYTKVLDADHKPILCTSCGLTSGGKRQMLKCDYCAAHWHLDCLDPPLANPPHINLESSHRDAWKCPRHIDHDLKSGYVAQNDLNEAQDALLPDAPVARLGRKVRKLRHPHIVEPTFKRGMRNNGLIEIINDPDDDTDGEGNYVYGSEEKDANSQVFRVPEKGIVLDFIDKVKSGRIAKLAQKVKKAEAAQKVATQRKQSMQNFAARSIEQQQAALNLTKLAQKEQDAGMHGNSIDALILSLTAEAPDAAVAAIADTPPPPPTKEEIAQLMKLQELIQKRLGQSP
ncbi:hypothetical protein K458DRAFT_440516 [Lentithecium fluviatile CBS 122367]|uniref:PHD-type domain-containing protein n=1 Tax=Lentithecium fluviatile CBS 122367 TaxID=1168545 RepID=A0A6G1JAW1_9PLEO|nr:hypothetical protein K458DRAFT_440516 [Lentithecium fluviatile CBS 122367]